MIKNATALYMLLHATSQYVCMYIITCALVQVGVAGTTVVIWTEGECDALQNYEG